MLSVDEFQDVTASAKPSCRVHHSTTQTLTTGTITALEFDSERFDRWEMHDPSTNNSRITVPVGGIYLIGAQAAFKTNTDGTFRDVGIRLNGSTIIAYSRQIPPNAIAVLPPVVTVYALSKGDYVEAIVQHNRGVDLDTFQAGNYVPEFWVAWHSRA